MLGMGVGTKFLSEKVLASERDCHVQSNIYHQNDSLVVPNCYGTRVRDCHAEVLARRAFRRYLSLQILKMMTMNSSQPDIKGGSAQSNTPNDESEEDESCLLERISVQDGNDIPCFKQPNGSNINREKDQVDSINDTGNCEKPVILFRLRPNLTLHFYCSSAPCGNAVFKKFAHGKPSARYDELKENEWPRDERHEPILAHAVPQGQFALLVKRDGGAAAVKSGTGNLPGFCKDIHEGTWPCYASDTWCPPGTTTVWTGFGSLHTCSDKLARWNCLGLQGSLLMRYLQQPLYMSTLTVGRKFTEPTCRRAVCCRIGPQATAGPSLVAGCDTTNAQQRQRRRKRRQLDESDRVFQNSPFRIHHPAIMGTDVYMDETGVIVTNGTEAKKQHVSFESFRSWAWWPGCHGIECIDGSTGYLISPRDRDELIDDDEQATDASVRSERMISHISTISLVELYLEIRSRGNSSMTSIALQTTAGATHTPVTLAALQQLKRDDSPISEQVKQRMLTEHSVFKHWMKR